MSEMKVWVLYDHVRYEGCGPPLAAFDTEEAAEQERKKRQASSLEDQTYDVKELIVRASLNTSEGKSP